MFGGIISEKWFFNKDWKWYLNVIVKKLLNVKLLTSKEACIFDKYTRLWTQQSDWLTVPIPYKQLFNLALKVGNRLIDFAFMFPLNDKQKQIFYFLHWWNLNFHNLWAIYTAVSHKNKFNFTSRVNLAQRRLYSIYTYT